MARVARTLITERSRQGSHERPGRGCNYVVSFGLSGFLSSSCSAPMSPAAAGGSYLCSSVTASLVGVLCRLGCSTLASIAGVARASLDRMAAPTPYERGIKQLQATEPQRQPADDGRDSALHERQIRRTLHLPSPIPVSLRSPLADRTYFFSICTVSCSTSAALRL